MDLSTTQLYGRDETENIVSVVFEGDVDGKASVTEYVKGVGGAVVPFYPFFFSKGDVLAGFDPEKFKWSGLKGENPHNRVNVFTSVSDYYEAIDFVARTENNRRPEGIYTVSSFEEQYLMQTGKTLFKGMTPDDLHRMQVDIETYSPTYSFPNPEKKSDEIIMIAVSDNQGKAFVMSTNQTSKTAENEVVYESEAKMLDAFVHMIHTADPDVIEGHNIYKYDIPYLQARCNLYGIAFDIGRGRSFVKYKSTSYRAAERKVEYDLAIIPGRHVIDTYFLTLAFDVFKRDMPSHTLKEAARYFGFVKEDREYVPGDMISKTWEEDPVRLSRYATDDVEETRKLADQLSSSVFYTTQMLPMLYGTVAVSGQAAKIEALLVREYLRQRHSMPEAEEGAMTTGGLTGSFVTGVVGPVLYADVESLYPSIMMAYKIWPEGDDLGVFQSILKSLTAFRFDAKDKMKTETDETKKSELDGRQNSYKIIINSLFGYLGFKYGIFNDYSEADRVTKTGQKILTQMKDLIEGRGGQMVGMDTDGILFVPPDYVFVGEQEANPGGMIWDEDFIQEISTKMPEGIRVGFDGRFEQMFAYKAKNYALKSFGGKIKYKGSAFRNRKEEAFCRDFLRTAIECILVGDVQKLHDTYVSVYDKILTKSWKPEEFTKSVTLNISPTEYKKKIEEGTTNRAAAYELVPRAKKLGLNADKGDRMIYYIGALGRGAGYAKAKLLQEYNRDEDSRYYVGRLKDVAERFKPFFTPADFNTVFSQDGLFGFTPEGIRILTTNS